MKVPSAAYNGFLQVYRPWSPFDYDTKPLPPLPELIGVKMRPALIVPTKFHFLKWLDSARKGDVCIYHVGFLTSDRMRSRPTNELGAAAWKAYNDGRVHLTQSRKEVTGSFYYMATKAGKK